MLRGVWGGGVPLLPHCMKPWYTYVNSPFIVLISDGVAIHTGKFGILEVKALNTSWPSSQPLSKVLLDH